MRGLPRGAGPARGGEGAPRAAERLRLRQRRHAGRPGPAPGRFKAIVHGRPDGPTTRPWRGWTRPGRSGSGSTWSATGRTRSPDSAAARFLARLKELGWYAQVFADDAQWPEVAPVLRDSGVKVLVDHFGVRNVAAGAGAAGFQAVLRLGRAGRAAVKLSAPFRAGRPRRPRPVRRGAARGLRPGRLRLGVRLAVPRYGEEAGLRCRRRGPAALAAGRGRPRARPVGQSRAAVPLRGGVVMPERARSLRVALAGAGMISRHHLLAWRALGRRVELVGVCDPDLGRARRARRSSASPPSSPIRPRCWTRPGPTRSTSPRPRETHAAWVEAAAARGIDVMCQKPLTPTLAEAEALVRRVAGRCRLMVHENWRFRPGTAGCGPGSTRVRWASCCPSSSRPCPRACCRTPPAHAPRRSPSTSRRRRVR